MKENARPWRVVCWLMVVTFLLAACSSPSAANGPNGPDGPGGLLDARTLLSQEDAEALMGEPSLEADCTDAHVEGEGTVSMCLYSAAADDSYKSVSLLARRAVRADPTLSTEVRAGLSEGGEEPVDLEGIGDAAFWHWILSGNALQLHVFSGGNLYLIAGVGGFADAGALEAAKTVALKALERLLQNGG